ncbi:MAG: aminoglycoside phosphotransferase (APT) family kinase protein [Candidatus Azotimanducaceae bacterium]|jgi:aminoglycoside phosphotransferase (APT) family kinase protein
MTDANESLFDFDLVLAGVLERHIDECKKFVSVERLSGGASQETYRIRIETSSGDKLLAMRRAAGGVKVEPVAGHPGLDVEALLMKSAHTVDVPVPEVYYVLQDEDGLGDGFIMSWLEGEALGARINRAPQFEKVRETLAYECGKNIARIHQIDLVATGLDKRLEVISPKEFVEQTWNRYIEFNSPHPMIDFTAQWLLQNLPTDQTFCLVHNDFRNGNFMVDEERIIAVLDWELAHIGDPMRDLGWICVNSWRFGGDKSVGGFGEYEDLFRGYEEVSGVKVDPGRVKYWEVFGSFWWAVGCLGMAEHYRTGPDKTVERPGIGRRSSECQIDCVNLLIPGAVKVVKTDETLDDLDMPRSDELISSVRDFLRGEVMAETMGRTNFMARVASNSLDIVLRELVLGPRARSEEIAGLQTLLGIKDTNRDSDASVQDQGLGDLRWQLTRGLRSGEQKLDDTNLQAHLRQTVTNQIAIDQPKYTGLKKALSS